MSTAELISELQKYYGEILQSSSDLKTSACCCTDEQLSSRVKAILSEVNTEVLERFYGCGSPFPMAVDGATVLDLGCGSGRDAFVLSKLVGQDGQVYGVDMTAQQLEVAQRNLPSQMKKFGYSRSNISFRQGYIEDLLSLGLADNSVDVVVSNCVINLSPDKQRVFSEIFRVLKPGGELLFSDVFTGRRVPAELFNDPVLHGECLAGALYTEDFRRMLQKLGCNDYRVMNKRRIALGSEDIEQRVGMIDFYSMTVRAFKLELEDICEDYGQVACYKGGIEDSGHFFELDDHHKFEQGKPMLVCGNTASMLENTRYGKYFTVTGDRSVHFGAFDCAPSCEEAVSCC